MEKRRPIGLTIVGVTQSVIFLILALPYLFLGTHMVLADVLSMIITGGGNLSGLGIIFGIPMIGIGVVFLFGFISALLLLKLNPKGMRRTVIYVIIGTVILWLVRRTFFDPLSFIDLSAKGLLSYYLKQVRFYLIAINVASIFYLSLPSVRQQFTKEGEGFTTKQRKSFIVCIAVIVLFAIFFAVYTVICTSKMGPEEAGRLQVEAYRKREAKKEAQILKQFQNSAIVSVKFSLRYLDNNVTREASKKDLKTMKAVFKQFVIDNIVNPIGPTDMPRFRTTDEEYVAEVTKTGYEKLKSNKYVFGISLWKY